MTLVEQAPAYERSASPVIALVVSARTEDVDETPDNANVMFIHAIPLQIALYPRQFVVLGPLVLSACVELQATSNART